MFSDLHEHIQGTFAAFSGHEGYEQQLALWSQWKRGRETERAKARWANEKLTRSRPRVRKYQSRTEEAKARWQKVKQSKTCRHCSSPPALRTKRLRGKRVQAVLCEHHLELARTRERQRYAAKRASMTANVRPTSVALAEQEP